AAPAVRRERSGRYARSRLVARLCGAALVAVTRPVGEAERPGTVGPGGDLSLPRRSPFPGLPAPPLRPPPVANRPSGRPRSRPRAGGWRCRAVRAGPLYHFSQICVAIPIRLDQAMQAVAAPTRWVSG